MRGNIRHNYAASPLECINFCVTYGLYLKARDGPSPDAVYLAHMDPIDNVYAMCCDYVEAKDHRLKADFQRDENIEYRMAIAHAILNHRDFTSLE